MKRFTVAAPQALPPAPVTVIRDLVYDGGGRRFFWSLSRGGQTTIGADFVSIARGFNYAWAR